MRTVHGHRGVTAVSRHGAQQKVRGSACRSSSGDYAVSPMPYRLYLDDLCHMTYSLRPMLYALCATVYALWPMPDGQCLMACTFWPISYGLHLMTCALYRFLLQFAIERLAIGPSSHRPASKVSSPAPSITDAIRHRP